jgi:hypothetical protein
MSRWHQPLITTCIASYDIIAFFLCDNLFPYFRNNHAKKHVNAELLQLIPLLHTHVSEKYKKKQQAISCHRRHGEPARTRH